MYNYGKVNVYVETPEYTDTFTKLEILLILHQQKNHKRSGEEIEDVLNVLDYTKRYYVCQRQWVGHVKYPQRVRIHGKLYFPTLTGKMIYWN